ncbi:mCG59835, isoform CRA_b, partial [Mus musculus]
LRSRLSSATLHNDSGQGASEHYPSMALSWTAWGSFFILNGQEPLPTGAQGGQRIQASLFLMEQKEYQEINGDARLDLRQHWKHLQAFITPD